MTRQHVTRLAPSPTGALHLGNARTFLVNHLLARRNGWRMLLRVEDLDGPRVKEGADRQMLDELRWLGLDWEPPVVYQSARAEAYHQALRRLIDRGEAYPCTCSRKDIEHAAGAPHAEDGAGSYPGTCRGRFASVDQARQSGRPVAWRVKVNGDPIELVDQLHGPVKFNLAALGGDFVIFKNVDQAAYQLAVVVDDAEAGVDCIVRGDDLLDSAARQIHLRRLLGIDGPAVRYWHLPLVVGSDGKRLAKRHGDTRLAHYRDAGASSQRVLGLLGYWSGLLETRRDATMDELERIFDLDRLPRQSVVFCQADDDYLRSR
ncbi:MAG: tRNA glutamyl-Q(34) synthetase GluQRS [Phycisphaerae bacterium]|jgi:glutamyl-tRNA synthetase